MKKTIARRPVLIHTDQTGGGLLPLLLIATLVLVAVAQLNPVMGAEPPLVPAVTDTAVPASSSTPTEIPSPTATLRLTNTPLPVQSPNVTFVYQDGEVTPVGSRLVEDTINVLYPQHTQFCGVFPVRVYVSADLQWLYKQIRKEGGVQNQPFGGIGFAEAMFINTGWPAWIEYNALGFREKTVAHELAHVCQHALSDSNVDWSVLWEGGADWLAAHMVIPWIQSFDGRRVLSVEEFYTRLLNQERAFCSVSVFGVQYAEDYHSGNAAWYRLIGDEVTSWAAYYQALRAFSKEKAFKDTFGMTPGEFQTAYIAECPLGFP